MEENDSKVTYILCQGRRRKVMKKRIVSVALILALCLNMLPAGVFAAEADETKICGHHPEHTAECGYVEEVQGSPCTHEHTEACYEFVTECIHEHTDECYSEVPASTPEEGGGESDEEQTDLPEEGGSASDTEQGNQEDTEQSDESGAEQEASIVMLSASFEGTLPSESDADQDRSLHCTHECSEESGCIVKKLHCTHEHDDACGYVESVPGHPCEYVCRICLLQELIDALPEKITEENREDVIGSLDEILDKYEALTGEEQEQVDLTRYEKLRDLLEGDEKGEPSYYLFVLHSLDLDGDLYCGTELIELGSDNLKEEYDLHEVIMDKEGMEAVGASYYDEASGGLEESWTVSLSAFTQAGDPEDGSDYYAVQAVIEYGVADGYTAVVPEDVEPADDPYGIMTLMGFTGGDIKDIIFEPANIVTVTVNYMYSPTGGLSGMPAAAPREYQIAVTKDTDAVLEKVAIPNADGGYPNLEGFRIVLDSAPLNAFLVNPALADEMSRNPDPNTIENALENDLFTIDTDKEVYYNQNNHSTVNPGYGNPYSDQYNAAWNSARSITGSDADGAVNYTATASSGSGSQNLGATPLTDPELTVTIPAARVNQILEALKANPDSAAVKEALTVTVYYRRNAGEYTVNHWVPYLSPAEQGDNEHTTINGVTYWNVYPEEKQGRIGAMTNAISGMDQMDRTGVDQWIADGGFDFRPYVTQGFAQQIVASGGTTEVDIYYDSASEYRIIFDTNDTYIPRVSVNANDTLVFDYAAGNGNGSLTVRDSSGADYPDQGAAADYQNPTRMGYRFLGWRYEVKADSGIADAYQDPEDGKWYVRIDDTNSSQFKIEVDENKTTVIVLASGDANTVKAIHLYPIWEEAAANVRVVFWTEDLGGAEKDVDVDVQNGKGPYMQNLGGAYLNGTADTVGSSFSNAGSFTFTATTGAALNLSVGSGQSAVLATSTAGTFQVTGDKVSGSLTDMINQMFRKRMSDVTPTAGAVVNSSVFYHPYAVLGADNNNFTVAADGSTVINIRYARNVYSLDFTYYGTVNGNPSIATNAKGYSGLDNPEDYAAQRTGVAGNLQNAWDRVTNVNNLTVPQKVTVRAKYGADLREVWPRTYSETIATTYGSNNSSRTPTFTSWATTAGGYNQRFKDNNDAEPTIMGVYSAMDVDVIADPTDSSTTHHMYAYWCPSKAPSHYRFNHCFEIPDLTWDELTSAADTRRNALSEKTVAGIGKHNPQTANDRADTIYLVPVNGTLGDKFADYADVLLKVTPGNGSYTFGEASENGTHYVVRRYESENNVAQKERVYALARQVDAISTNTVKNQNPSARLHMERANGIPDHATNASDDDGRSTYDDPNATNADRRNYQIGTAENPYDLFFYYDRERMTITYMVPARDSDSGEYTLGTKEVPYGASLKKYDVQLDGNPSSAGNNGTPDNKRYSNDPKFAGFWQAVGTGNAGEGLQNGYARTAPNSAADGKGIWTFQGWSLDRALSQSADFTGTMSGNLRLFANWTEPTYQVTFDLAGGVLADGATGPIVEEGLLANQGYTSNEKADIPRPTRNGFTLSGWKWFEEDGVTEVSNFTFETPITRNMAAVAQWTTYAEDPYQYKVWYLTNDTDPVTRREGEGWIDEQESGTPGNHTQNGAVNTTNYNKVLGCKFITGRFPKGINLLLGAERFEGYLPYNGNASILLGDSNPDATAADTQYVAYFYYNKARIQWVVYA